MQNHPTETETIRLRRPSNPPRNPVSIPTKSC